MASNEDLNMLASYWAGEDAVENDREVRVSVRKDYISVVVKTRGKLSGKYECKRDRVVWTLLSSTGKLVQVFYGISDVFPNSHLIGNVVTAVCKEEDDSGRLLI